MLEKIKKKLHQHPFLKNIMVLFSGNILGYAINLFALPFISRVFSPMEMGEYDLILSSGRFVSDIIGLGLLIAIMLPKSNKEAKKLCKFITISNIIALTILFAFFSLIANIYHLFDISIPYIRGLLLLAVYLLTYNMQSIFYCYTNREKKYNVLFWNPFIMAVSNVGISLLLGIMGLGTTGYLLGTIFSYIICILYMRSKVNPYSETICLSDCKDIFINYKDIITVQLPANFISQVGSEIPIQYLGRVFGATVLGGYSMAIRILDVAVNTLSVPVNRVVYQTMAEKINKNESVGEFVFHILEKNIKLALLPIGALVLLGEMMVPLILGESWMAAGEYIVLLGSVYLLKFCSGCLSGTFVVMKRPKWSLWLSVLNLIKFAICFGIAYVMKCEIYSTIILYAIAEWIYQVILLISLVYSTGYSINKVLEFVSKYVIGGNIVIYGIYILIKFAT